MPVVYPPPHWCIAPSCTIMSYANAICQPGCLSVAVSVWFKPNRRSVGYGDLWSYLWPDEHRMRCWQRCELAQCSKAVLNIVQVLAPQIRPSNRFQIDDSVICRRFFRPDGFLNWCWPFYWVPVAISGAIFPHVVSLSDRSAHPTKRSTSGRNLFYSEETAILFRTACSLRSPRTLRIQLRLPWILKRPKAVFSLLGASFNSARRPRLWTTFPWLVVVWSLLFDSDFILSDI